MMKIILVFIFLVSTSSVFAQAKTANNDLRGGVELFSISYAEESKKHLRLVLIRSVSGAHSIVSLEKSSKLESQKIDSDTAKLLDEKFADDFINLKYLMPAPLKVKCQSVVTLVMRGEKLSVCKSDEVRVNQISKIINSLKLKLI
jgi:hypothetical protein